MIGKLREALWSVLTPPKASAILQDELYGAERDLLAAINVAEHAQSQVEYKRARFLRLRAMANAVANGQDITDVEMAHPKPAIVYAKADTFVARSGNGGSAVGRRD